MTIEIHCPVTHTKSIHKSVQSKHMHGHIHGHIQATRYFVVFYKLSHQVLINAVQTLTHVGGMTRVRAVSTSSWMARL